MLRKSCVNRQLQIISQFMTGIKQTEAVNSKAIKR